MQYSDEQGAQMPRLEVLTEVSERDPQAAPARSVRRATARRASNRRATARRRQGDTRASIIDFLAKHPGSTAGDLAKSLNLNSESVANRLTQLSKTGAIYKASHGYSTQPAPDSLSLLDAQQQRLLDRLRQAGDQPVAFAELHAAGITFPAAVIFELELNGYLFERVHHQGQLVGVRLLHPEPSDTSAPRRRRRGPWPHR